MLADPTASRAVLIGTSEYQTLQPIPAVANNLTGLRDVLRSDDLWGLPDEHFSLVHNPRTTTEMLDPLRTAALEATDTLILYFAGHGLMHTSSSALYLALVGSDNDRIYSSVAYDYIRTVLRDSRARRKIIILDSCHSGLARDVMSDTGATVASTASVHGTYLMASTGPYELSKFKPGAKYTAFSGELIRLLEDGIPGEPDYLDLDTIFSHVQNSLLEEGLPVPQKRETYMAAQLAFVRNRASRAVSSAPQGYGAIPGVSPGRAFFNRRELHDAGVHRPLQAGICGTAAKGGAESIVVSGGYRDDKDYGEVIIYTGHGGRDPDTGQQIEDQSPTDSGNAALLTSVTNGMPLRVIRGAGSRSPEAPRSGYRYDGLFQVTESWMTDGIDGFRVMQFRLEQTDPEPTPSGRSRRLGSGRWDKVSHGVYVDRARANHLKRLYDFACQICGTVLEIPGGLRFASAVHIRSLGRPHDGPDVLENMLCLCSNDRDLFVYGALIIDDDFQVVDQTDDEPVGELTLKHTVDLDHVRYHREHHKASPPD